MREDKKNKKPKEKQPSFFENALTWEDVYVRVPPELMEFIKKEEIQYSSRQEYLRTLLRELCRTGVTYSSTHQQNGTTRTPTTAT